MVGFLFAGFFVAVVVAYGCTEYLFARLDPGGSRSLYVILTTNLMTFAILWVTGLVVLILASGAEYYWETTIVAACAQAVWLAQHLWSYYRDHPRLRYEN